MGKIKLTHGKIAIVDKDNFEWLNQWKWYCSDGGYAVRSKHVRLGVNRYSSKKIWMHRLINLTPKGYITDHINRDKLDNRRKNLRNANKSINSINRANPVNNTSGYKGVYWDKFNKKWRAEIKVNYKKISLGRYKNIVDAISARRGAEKTYHAI